MRSSIYRGRDGRGEGGSRKEERKEVVVKSEVDLLQVSSPCISVWIYTISLE